MTFVFRNNTIEQFFELGYQFSGYDDVSYIPEADAYVFWFQVPLRFNYQQQVEEVRSYCQKLQFVASRVERPFFIFTLEQCYFSQIESGNYDLANVIDNFNSLVRDLTSERENVKLIDFRDFAIQYRTTELIDWRYYYTAQIPYNPQLIGPFKKWWSRKLEEIQLSRKKCLVLDLDNTLWSGILGEDGVNNVSLSGDYPGKAFHYWQEGLKELQKQGVMLAICSKNNEKDVEELWEKRSDMVLKKEDFVAFRINWLDKSTNLADIAKELNIGLDSFVFVDDNPTERELIRQTLPMVSVPDYPEHPYGLPLLYQELVKKYFCIYTITAEDREKTKQYAVNAQRRQVQAACENYEDFLRSLDISLKVEPINDVTIVRAAQMTQKTNQFNLTTKRYTVDDIRSILSNGGKAWTLSVSDKFGDSGITGLFILTSNGTIDTMLMSCRVLGKGIEEAFVKYVLSVLKKNGMTEIRSSYSPTAKNVQVKDFWEKIGFALTNISEDGQREYVINLKTSDSRIKDYYKID